ncbi:MAG: PDZ domain-containing protein [Actinomycetes bacterium]
MSVPSAPPPSTGMTARRSATLTVAAVLAVGLGLVMFLLPVPYVELQPGRTCNVLTTCPDDNGNPQPVLQISHRTFPASGHLNLTTVSVSGGPGTRRLTLYDALRGWFSSSAAVIPKDFEFPPNQSGAEVDCRDTKDQESSQNNATTAALRSLGYRVPVTQEVFITGFTSTSPARAAGIGVCDDITAIDGKPVTSQEQLPQLVRGHAPGTTISVSYTPNGTTQHQTAQVKLVATPGKPGVGFMGVEPDEIEHSHPPFKVVINVGPIGGPSAGLMYALGIYDKLTPGDLTGGVFVAGTGTINDNGQVGPIGGIAQKMLGARQQGASVFLVPKSNCSEAVGAKPKGLRLVSVATLSEALSALTALRNDAGGTIHDCTR